MVDSELHDYLLESDEVDDSLLAEDEYEECCEDDGSVRWNNEWTEPEYFGLDLCDDDSELEESYEAERINEILYSSRY